MKKIWAKASENNDEIEFNENDLPTTKWHSICFKQFIKIDGTNRLFFRYWEIHFLVPSILIFITAFVFTIFILAVVYNLIKILQIICLTEVIIFLVLYLINYFEAMCMDPGFLPYFWPAIEPSARRLWYNWEEQLTYLAISSRQFEIASFSPLTNSSNNSFTQDTNVDANQSSGNENLKGSNMQAQNIDDDSIINNEENNKYSSNISTSHTNEHDEFASSKLQFASFSKSSGRFVIRADHICGWIGNWVGKRNHKQFILFTFYSSIFFLSLLLWRIAPKHSNMKSLKDRSKTLYYLDITSVVLEVLLVIILIPFFVNQMYQLSQGKTQLQLMKERRQKKDNKKDNNVNCMHEMRQVCGEGNLICWICPIPAFGKEIHIEGYS